jgi:hypothetical protein
MRITIVGLLSIIASTAAAWSRSWQSRRLLRRRWATPREVNIAATAWCLRDPLSTRWHHRSCNAWVVTILLVVPSLLYICTPLPSNIRIKTTSATSSPTSESTSLVLMTTSGHRVLWQKSNCSRPTGRSLAIWLTHRACGLLWLLIATSRN